MSDASQDDPPPTAGERAEPTDPEAAPRAAMPADPTARSARRGSWRRTLHRLAAEAEIAADRTRYRLLPPRLSRLTIQPYRGFATSRRLRLRGRVLADPGIRAPPEGDSRWSNLLHSLRRFESDEMPGARVRAHLPGVAHELVADEEGYLALEAEVAEPLQTGWQTVRLELVHPVPRRRGGSTAAGSGDPRLVDAPVLVAGDDPPLVVVSDLDDTVIQTGVGSLVQMARGLLFQGPRTRLPFPGVAAFYRALQAGVPAQGTGAVPVLYLSSSPWNLYDLLEAFFQLRGIPLGPLLLRDWGLSRESLFAASHHSHKLGHLLDLLAFFPRSRFLLIGDSGQHDPEIYREAAQRHPGRIAGVYIRDVSPRDERDAAIRAHAPDLAAVGADLVLTPDTVAMAEHAAARGWIAEDAVAAVAADRDTDGGPGGGS